MSKMVSGNKVNVKAITHGANKAVERHNIDLVEASNDFMQNILGTDARTSPSLKLEKGKQSKVAAVKTKKAQSLRDKISKNQETVKSARKVSRKKGGSVDVEDLNLDLFR